MALKPVFPSHLYEKDFHILPFLFIATVWYGCMPTHTKSVDPLSGSEIPVEWEALDQNNSFSDDQNVTYWMDSFENKSLNEAVYTAWIANPSLVAMAEQTLARRRGGYRRGFDYTTGKSRSKWIEE